MELEKEAEIPAVGEGETPGREAEIPQATAVTTEPSVESSAAKRAASPGWPRCANLLCSQVHG